MSWGRVKWRSGDLRRLPGAVFSRDLLPQGLWDWQQTAEHTWCWCGRFRLWGRRLLTGVRAVSSLLFVFFIGYGRFFVVVACFVYRSELQWVDGDDFKVGSALVALD